MKHKLEKPISMNTFRDLTLFVLVLILPFQIIFSQNSEKVFNSYELLKQSSPRGNDYKMHIQDADFYDISESNRLLLSNRQPTSFVQELKIKNKIKKIEFTKVEVLASGFHVKTSDGQTIYPDRDKYLFYRGHVLGEKNTLVTLSIIKNELKYIIATDLGNYEINQNKEGQYIGYFSADLNKKMTYHSNTVDAIRDKVRHQTGGNRTGNCIEVYLECDFYTNQLLGGVSQTSKWITSIFADVAAVFALHDVPVILSQVFVWNTQDPYANISNVSTLKNQFVSTLQNNYTGRVAQFVTLRQLNGGIANGIGGFCNSYPTFPGPQCVSTGLSSTVDPFPNYSFNTYIIAHELGHVMGLRHTHACVWNGTFVQVDDCGNVIATQNGNTPEGATCYNVNNPILPTSGGTIMSECHLLTSTGINLNLGFGTLPGLLLYENFIYGDCMTGTTCGGLPPVNDLCIDAIILPVTNTCNNHTFTNQNATDSNGPPAFSCGNPGSIIKDVWFKITIPPSGNVTIATSQSSGGLTDVILQAYSGTCGSLTTIGCDDNNGVGNHALLTVTGRTPGEIIFVRLVDSQSNDEGTFNICAYDISIPCHPDYSALVSFYNSTGGSLWTVKTGWQAGAAGSDCNVCNWYGVSCNELGRVSTIQLSSNNLTSNNISSTLTNLTYLTDLKLYNNNLSGSIPSFFNSFSFLRTIDLGNNDFSGSIPSYLGNISTLKNLYLDGNLLSGSLPSELTNNELSLIYLNNNNLSGCFPASYVEYCSRAFNFFGNPLLAEGISFYDLCSLGNGVDADMDSFCKGGSDCDDTDNSIYPGATEVCNLKDDNCNGLIDDIPTPLTNTWIGGNGNWHLSGNWSLGIVPERCHNVVISGSNGITVSIQGSQIANARSVTIQSGKSLSVEVGSELIIDHGLNIVNAGTINNNGTLTIHNILDNALFGIINSGSITNGTTGVITIEHSGVRSISNSTGGVIINNGYLTIDSSVNNINATGLYNFGSVNNTGNLVVRNIIGNEIRIAPGATFTNQSSGVLSVE